MRPGNSDLCFAWPERKALFPDHAHWIDAYATRFNDSIPGPVPGSLEIVEELDQAGMPLFAITNFGAEFWDGFAPHQPVFARFREIIVSGLREFLAGLQVSVPVSRMAKWKTTLQLVALGALILAGAIPQWPWVHVVGLISLWAAAALTMVTGWDYLRVGMKHMD